jgi:hypothetical protein
LACAAHVFPHGTAVSYIGWNAYGCTWHLAESGWNMIWPKPLRVLAVIDPCWHVFWSAGKLSIASAAHYCRAVQPKPSNWGT